MSKASKAKAERERQRQIKQARDSARFWRENAREQNRIAKNLSRDPDGKSAVWKARDSAKGSLANARYWDQQAARAEKGKSFLDWLLK